MIDITTKRVSMHIHHYHYDNCINFPLYPVVHKILKIILKLRLQIGQILLNWNCLLLITYFKEVLLNVFNGLERNLPYKCI